MKVLSGCTFGPFLNFPETYNVAKQSAHCTLCTAWCCVAPLFFYGSGFDSLFLGGGSPGYCSGSRLLLQILKKRAWKLKRTRFEKLFKIELLKLQLMDSYVPFSNFTQSTPF